LLQQGTIKPDNHDAKTIETKTKTYEYWRAVKIVSQRNNNEQTQYFIQWEDRSLPDTWCNAADVDDNLRRVFYLTHTDTGARCNELLDDTIQTTLSIQNNRKTRTRTGTTTHNDGDVSTNTTQKRPLNQHNK